MDTVYIQAVVLTHIVDDGPDEGRVVKASGEVTGVDRITFFTSVIALNKVICNK